MRLRQIYALLIAIFLGVAFTACEPDDSGKGGGWQKPDYIEDELNGGSQAPSNQ